MLLSESNYDYCPLTHLEAGDVVAALREWVVACVEEDDRVRVERLLHRAESSLDIVLVARHSSIAGEMRGTSILPGGPAGGDSARGGLL